MTVQTFYEISTWFFGLFTALGTVGACIIALKIIDIKRLRIKACKYDFKELDNIKFKIDNKNSDEDLIIRNLFLTARHREISDFHLRLTNGGKDVDEMSVLPGAFYCNTSPVYQTNSKDYCGSYPKSHKVQKSNKPLEITDVIKEWKKKKETIGTPQLYFDTNFGKFTSNPSKLAKKVWKKHFKNLSKN